MMHRLCLILIAFVPWWKAVLGLTPAASAKRKETSEGEKTDVYKIVGLPGGRTEHLPASYVKTFPQWQLDSSGELVAISTEECSAKEKESANPTVSVQPTLNFLLKGGVPSYLFVGLWMDDQQNSQLSAESNHLAQQWTTFAQAAKSNFRIEVFMGPGNGSDDQRLGVADAERLTKAVEQLGKSLSTTQNQNLANGFHIVSIPLKMDTMEDLDMARGKGGIMMLTCIATDAPDALELLGLDDSLLEKTAASKLEIEAFKVLSTF